MSDESRLRLLARRWELRKSLILPVLANLTTATIVFVGAAICAPLIRRLFITPGVAGYPLYCVVEPYNGLHDTVLVDLSIVNLTDREVTYDALQGLVERGGAGSGLTPSLVVRADHPMVDSIVRVGVDSAYNAGKGHVNVSRRTPQTYEFSVERIDPGAIMRFTIVTNMILTVTSRSNRDSDPVRCESPYRFPHF